MGVGVVATNDVHYATPDGHRLHDVLTATRHNVPLAELGLRQRPNSEFYLKGEAEMAALFAECPDALAATQAIAERCDVSLDFARRRLPAFPPRSESLPARHPAGRNRVQPPLRPGPRRPARQIPSGHAAGRSGSSPTSWR